MKVRDLKPTSQREWSLVGMGALAAALVLALVTTRYDYRPLPGGADGGIHFLRIDHWTGGAAVCYIACRAVDSR